MILERFFSSMVPKFEQYQVCPPGSNEEVPKLTISAVAKTWPSQIAPSPINVFTTDYLTNYHARFEENGYFARADDRAPEEMDYIIQPKCFRDERPPHYDVMEHRRNSDCSGFVSLSDNMLKVKYFGGSYALPPANTYYLYIGKYVAWYFDRS